MRMKFEWTGTSRKKWEHSDNSIAGGCKTMAINEKTYCLSADNNN